MAIWKVPRLTTAQRLGITPAASEIFYDTTLSRFFGGDGVTVGGIPITSIDSGELLYVSARLAEFDTPTAKQEARSNLGLEQIDAGTFS